jgi:hypothetical protein
MFRLAILSALMLSGCIVVPMVDSSGHVTGCCEAFIAANRSTLIGLSAQKTGHTYDLMAHAKWAF